MRRLNSCDTRATMARRFELLKPTFNERTRRQWAASEALALGWGGIAMVESVTGLSRKAIEAGIAELQDASRIEPAQAGQPATTRIRKPGGGRKSIEETDPGVRADLESLVSPNTRGDPQSALQWVSKSVRHLADALRQMGHTISYETVDRMLQKMGFSLQANRKTQEGASHPDRDAQFGYINEQVKLMQSQDQPVISVDCKKKEIIGQFKNNGREWQPKAQPQQVQVHDFPDPEKGKAIPYGVYDITDDQGWISVGCDHDTAEFAVASIEKWWNAMGKQRYGDATDLMIVSDCGGSNSNRCRLWKTELQAMAQRTGLHLHIHHLPPGTSKWNKIEHSLFSLITLNWRARPLVSLEVIVNLIANTCTASGKRVTAVLDSNAYPTKQTITHEQMQLVNLIGHSFHCEWNYDILPSICLS